jgi:4-amino-4-deoxy-L-arabinose transferase-like glycosyltransferase
MKQLTGHLALLISVAVIVLFTNLGASRLWDDDEPRNAGCALEMIERGDWVVPMFNAKQRTAKPVLLYWLIMSAYAVFGVNEFAARFWSAALALGTVLATYAIGRRLFNPTVALWAALILCTSVMFDVAAHAATPDSVLIFFSTLAIMTFVLGTFKPKDAGSEDAAPEPKIPDCFFPSSWPVVALMYGFMGMAILAKGPVGLVLPTAVIGMFLLILRLPESKLQANTDSPSRLARLAQWCRAALRPFAPLHFLRTCWSMRPITALAIALAIALPWYAWVGMRTNGEWLHDFFVNEHLRRATEAMENHGGPVVYYVAAIMAGFFPWSLLLLPVVADCVRRLKRRDSWSTGYVFMACWVGVYVGLFSLAKTKLPSYVTPCYPALALLAGCFVFHWTRGTALTSRWWPRWSFTVLAVVGLAFTIAVPLLARRILPGIEWLGAFGLIPLVGAIVCLVLAERGRPFESSVTFAATAIAFLTAIFGFAAERVDRQQQTHELLAAIDRHSQHPQVASFNCLEPSWVYYGRRPILELSESPDTLSPDKFLARGNETFVITSESNLQQIQAKLPSDVHVIAEVPYFLKFQKRKHKLELPTKQQKLVVLGHTSDTPRAADNASAQDVRR